MSATLASVLLVFLVVSLTQPHLLDSRAAKPRLTHLLDSRAAKPRLTLYSLDSRAATVRRPSSSLTIPYQCWTSTRPLLEVTTYLATRILLSTSSSMATMTGLDKLELFNPHLETFERYVQRVKIYFAANGVREERKKFVFLNSLGVKHFNLLANLLSPDDPTTKTFDELVEILDKHFRPTTSVVAERYRLNCRRQRENESIADFVADLKRLIVPCKYPADTQDMILRDRFVFGLLSESTRKRLLTEKDDTTFSTAVEIASSLETATVHAKQMGPSESKVGFRDQPIQRLAKNPIECYRCGGPHLANVCRHITSKCRACAKTGHIAKVCRSKHAMRKDTTKFRDTRPGQPKSESSGRTHTVEEGISREDGASSDSSYPMLAVVSRSQPIILSVMVNNRKLDMELDTGASVSVISEDTYNAVLRDTVSLVSTDVSLRSYLGEQLPCIVRSN